MFNGVHVAQEEGGVERVFAVNERNTWVQLEKPHMYICNAHIFSFRGLGVAYILSALSSGS